ncbi:MAG TPA: tetratricopeptide repeat protein, partial [Nitrososphaeraceae archaeon]|nr:tetratricopeptide repeat protein [Nitrososphaeraceae archaeon]
MERFNFDELAIEDETLHLDIRNIESKSRDYKEWNKLAKDLIDRGNRYKFFYEKSKSEYANEKLKSIYGKSIVCSDKSIELDPRNIDAWYNKGLALNNLAEYKEAIKCYDKVIEIDPDYFPVWNLKGNALNYLGKFQEAIKSYDQVLEKDPQNIIAFYNKGLALSNLGEYEKAIKCYDRVIEIDHENIDALNTKGLAFERLRKFEEAIKCYDRVIEIDHENIEALNSKGYALDRLERYDEAEQYYKKVSEEYLNEINDMNERAKECQNLHKYDEAIMYYDRVISIDANNSNAWLKKGVLLYNLDKYEEAIDCYNRVIGLDKYKEKLKKEGQKLTDKQVIEYYKSIETNPRNIEALNEKGLALEKLGKYDDAIQLFDLIIEKNPPFTIDTIIKKGDIFMKLENYQAAEKSYNDALKYDPHNIPALNKLHTLYSNYTFQYDKAISVSQLLLENLSVSQTQNSDKLINYVYTKSQRKKNIQAKQKKLLNEEILDAKFLLSEDFIKNSNYKQGRKIAKETIKDIPKESIKRQIITRFLIIASYLLQGKKDEGILELDKFLTYYRNLDIDIKIEENQWNFKGIINAINENKNIDGAIGKELNQFNDNLSTKSILRNLIDLLCGFTDSYKILLKTTVETIDIIYKKKIRKKIIKTAIISLVVVAALSIIYVQMVVPESCSVPESRQINIGNVGSAPIGIDFNPNDNKAYVANEKDSTISIIDCNVPRYYNIFKQYFGFDTFDTQLQVEGKTISLDYPPSGIAVNPTTNKIYVIHQLPSPSLSIIDGNNNYQKLRNIPMGNPLDIAINPITKKVYVTNSIDGNVSVIDGETDKWITDINVGGKPLNVGINPTTNKIYVTHEGSNNVNVSIIDETKGKKEKDYIKNIFFNKMAADLNINSKTNKVYVTHPITNTISIIDGISDTKIKEEIDVGDKPIRIDIDEDTNKVFVVNQNSDSVSVINGTTNIIIKTLKIPGDKPYDVEFNSDINSAYIINMGSNSRSTVDIMKYDDGNQLNYIHVGDKPVDIDVNPETNKTYVVNYDNDTLSIINSTNRVEDTIDVGDKPRSVAVNPTTNKIYVTHQTPSPSLSVIDGNNNYQKLRENIAVGKDPLDIAVNTNSNKVYVANYGDGTVSVIDGKTDQFINKSMDVDENPLSIDVNPNTNKVYVGYSNNFHLSVIDDKSNRLLRDINDEPVKIGLFYPCPSDIAINQEKNHTYVSFDCKDHIFLINESDEVIPTKASTLGTNNTNIVFNP